MMFLLSSLRAGAGCLLSLATLMLIDSGIAAVASDVVKSGDSIAFLGDSITQNGWESPGGYVKLTISGLAQLGIVATPIPAGISGNTSKDMIERLDRDVLSKKPTWMTLSCGVNDVWHGANGVDLEHYKANISSIVDQTIQHGIKVIVLTATPIGEEDNDNNRKLVPYNAFLHELATQRGLPLIDLNADFQAVYAKAPPHHPERMLTQDGVHPNPDGNVVMAEGCLRGLGISPAQIVGIEGKWCSTPGTAELPEVYDARPFRLAISLGQYRGLNALARSQGIADPRQLHYTLSLRALAEVLKEHEKDTLLDMGTIRSEASARMLVKIDEYLAAHK